MLILLCTYLSISKYIRSSLKSSYSNYISYFNLSKVVLIAPLSGYVDKTLVKQKVRVVQLYLYFYLFFFH